MFVLFYVALHRLFQGHYVCISSSFCVFVHEWMFTSSLNKDFCYMLLK